LWADVGQKRRHGKEIVPMKLRPLASLELELALERVFVLGTTPKGNRMIAEIKSAELSGSRVKASMKGLAAADWAVLGDDGLARFDIRMVLETTDDALIYLSYTGKANWSAGPGSGPIFSVAEFETAADRYRWLNEIQVVGQGAMKADFSGVQYDFFELVGETG
jgi:surface antigen